MLAKAGLGKLKKGVTPFRENPSSRTGIKPGGLSTPYPMVGANRLIENFQCFGRHELSANPSDTDSSIAKSEGGIVSFAQGEARPKKQKPLGVARSAKNPIILFPGEADEPGNNCYLGSAVQAYQASLSVRGDGDGTFWWSGGEVTPILQCRRQMSHRHLNERRIQ